MQDWVELIIRIGEENGFWPAGRTVTTTPKRYRPGASDVMALRVGHDKLTRETGWQPQVSWEDGVLQTIRWYAENRDRWIGRVDWLLDRRPDGAHVVSRVLVTGGGGFLGSHLVERLEADGHDVAVPRRVEFDLTDMTDTARLFDEAEPEIVFHLAAEVGGIGANRANPGRYWYANLMMGAHVLEQARLHDTAKLVLAGTVCAYPKFTPVPFREDDLWDGYPEETNAPYGVAKKALLVGAAAYREQYGLDTIFLLPTNLYGPRDNFDLASSHVIPALIRKMVDSPDEIVLWGDGTPTREYLYVDDCVEGLLLAAAALRRRRARQPGHRRRDVDQGDRRDRRRGGRVQRRDPLGHVDAERPAATIARPVARPRALRLQRPGAAARGNRPHGRLVPVANTGRSSPGRGYPDGPSPGGSTPPADPATLSRPARIEARELRLEQRQPLGQHRALIVELRQHRRVVQQHDDDEQRRDGEEDRRRVGLDPEPAGDRVQAAAPGREDEQHDAGDEPQQGVALLEAPAADQLEHDQDQEQRGDRGRDRDLDGSHELATSSFGTAYLRTIAMNSASVTLST